MLRNILRPEILSDISHFSRKFGQNDRSKLSTFLGSFSLGSFTNSCNKKIDTFRKLFLTQCNAVAIHRIKRGCQIVTSYNRLYDKKLAEEMMRKFLQNLKKRSKGVMFSGAFFAGTGQKISEDELQNSVADLRHIENLNEYTRKQRNSPKDKNPVADKSSNDNGDDSHYMDAWECILDKDTFKIWRKPVPDSHLFEYKVFGTFNDISATDFLAVQVDLDYRKTWDKRVIKLEKVEEDKESNNEIVHWVTHYVYPMHPREYVYQRRYKVYEEDKVMVLISRSTDHSECPETKDYVRVKSYNSIMVIKPHSEFDQNGLNYVITYHDDPQAPIPTVAYKWVTRSALPDFVEALHKEAKNYQNKHKSSKKVNVGNVCKEVKVEQYHNAQPIAA